MKDSFLNLNELNRLIRKMETSSFAMWSLILGFMGVIFPMFVVSLPILVMLKMAILIIPPIFAIIFGIIGLKKIIKSGKKGKWMAILGIILGILYFLLYFFSPFGVFLGY